MDEQIARFKGDLDAMWGMIGNIADKVTELERRIKNGEKQRRFP